MARRKRFRISPRFFLTLLVLAGVAGGVFFVVKKLGEPKEDPNATPTPVMTMTPAPTMTPKPSLPPQVSVVRSESSNPSTFGFKTELQVDRRSVTSFSRSEKVSFGRAAEYSAVPGVLTFGGNSYRNSFAYGVTTVSDKRLAKKWEKIIGGMDSWTGTGWTGQPLIVQWPAEVRAVLGVADSFKTDTSFTEVIYPAMDGFIYFFDLNKGTATRNPISTGVVNKGTACLDPRGYPLLYVGQGIPVENEAKNGQAYVRVYSLITNEEIYKFGGYDYFSMREWQAYDGSPMISNDTIVFGGENGVLYSALLNTKFDATAKTVTIEPTQWAKYRYSASGYSKSNAKGSRWYGIESSVAAFRNYAFFTDNGGRLQCVDLDTYKLKYVTDVTDESDASVVIDESYDDSTIYLYTGSMVSKAGGDLGDDYGYTYHRKINGLTGAVVWEQKWVCSTGDENISGGTLATPHAGHGNIEALVIYSVSTAAQTASGSDKRADANSAELSSSTDAAGKTAYALGGRIVAYNKQTGEIAWVVEQDSDFWSSPAVVYDENSKAYLIQCDRGGFIRLFDASNGTELFKLDLGSRIDSTPAVFNNTLVVGTRGKGGSGQAAKIIAVRIS